MPRTTVCGTRSDSFIAHTKVPFITQRTTDLKFRARETKAPGMVFLKKSEITTFTYSKKECGLKKVHETDIAKLKQGKLMPFDE